MEILIVIGVIVLLVVIVGIYLWSTYNGLVTLNVRVDEAWSDITVQLKRRADLIPNLIEAVKGYAAHEKAVFENVTKARAETLSAQGPVDAAAAEALAVATAAIPEVETAVDAASGFTAGQLVTVRTEDPGANVITGRLARLSAAGITILRDDAQVGTVAVHFPRLGQIVLPA